MDNQIINPAAPAAAAPPPPLAGVPTAIAGASPAPLPALTDHERAAEAYRNAKAAMDQIVPGLTQARVDELTRQADAAFVDYDAAVQNIDRRARMERMENDAAARDETRRIEGAGARDAVARAAAPQDDNVISPDQLRERSRLIYRHYYEEERLTDSEQVAMHRLTNDERRFWQALRMNSKRASVEHGDLMVPYYPSDLTLARANHARELPEHLRAVSTTANIGTDADGGFLVPEGFQAELIVAMKAFGPLHDTMLVRILPTMMGNDIPWPTMDDTGNKGVQIAEGADAAFAKLAFGSFTLRAYKYTSKAFAVTREALQDSALPLDQIIRDAMAERLGRKLNEDFTQADGSSKPTGVVHTIKGQSTQVNFSATANTLTVDEIIELIHTIDPAYRMRRCRFMMNDNTALAARKLKDGENRYYLQPDIRDATRMMLFGYPVVINQDMESYGAGKYPILFGDFKKFLIRMVRGFVIRRLDELYAISDQVAFVGFCRHDSRVLDHRAFAIQDSDQS